MATLATLAISLVADTRSFQRSMEKSRKESIRLRRALHDATRPLENMARHGKRAAIALTALTAALVVGTQRTTAYARQIRASAEQVGLSIESMQRLTHAAGETNVEFATLQTALRGFARRSAEAARGNVQFLKGFERLGISQEDVADNLHDIEGLFLRVAGEISEMGTTADQSAVAMDLMSDAGRQMIPMLRRGEDGIRALMREADELNLVLGEKTVMSFDLLGRELDTTKQRISVASQELLANFIPAMRLLDEWVNRGITAWNGIDDAVKQNVVRAAAIVAAILGTVSALGVLAGALKAMIMLFKLTGLASVIAFAPVLIKIGLVAGAVYLLYRAWDENWGGIQTKTMQVWAVVEPVFAAMWDWFGKAWDWVVRIGGNAWMWITQTSWAEKWEGIKGWLTDGWSWMIRIGGNAWNWLTQTSWAQKWEGIKGWLTDGWSWFLERTGVAWDWIEDNLPWFADTVKTVKDALEGAWDWVISEGGNAWDHFQNSSLMQWVKDFQETLTNSSAWRWVVDIAWPEASARVAAWWSDVREAWDNEDASILEKSIDTIEITFGHITSNLQELLADLVVRAWNAVAEKIPFMDPISAAEIESTQEFVRGMQFDTTTGATPQYIPPETMPGGSGGGTRLDTGGTALSPGAGARFAYTADDVGLLTRMVAAEAAGESMAGQQAVAAVIINRMLDERWPDTIADVLFEPNQFSPVGDGRFYNEFTDAAMGKAQEAVMAAIYGIDPSQGAYFFMNPETATNDWQKSREISTTIGQHQFRYQNGTPWTGSGPLDEVAGIVHRQEAVIPAKALRKGPAGVLDFLGMPGFRSGKDAPMAMPSGGEGGDVGMVATMIGTLSGWVENARGLLGDDITDKFLSTLQSITGMLGTVETEFGRLVDTLGGAEGNLEEVLANMEALQKAQQEELELAARLKAAEESRLQMNNQLIGQIPLLGNAILQAKDVFEKTGEPMLAVRSFFQSIALASEPLQEALRVLAVPIQIVADVIGTLLLPILKMTFPIIKFFGLVLIEVAKIVGSVWNLLLDLVSLIPLVNLRKYKIDIDALSDASRELAGLTWEEAEAKAGLTEATERATQAMLNVPSGFRVEPFRFDAAGTNMATAGSTRSNRDGGSGGDRITQNITIVSNDPEDIWRKMQKIQRRENERSGGTILTTAAPGLTR